MAHKHMHASHPSLSNPASDSYATHLSLRRPDSDAALHPLKQNPPSTISLAQPIEDLNFDDVDLDGPRPPPSALTTTNTHYDPGHEYPSPLETITPRTLQGHQRSLTGTFLNNCQPFLSRATSTIQQHTSRASLHSPTKSLASFIPSRSVIESTASQPKIKAGAKALQNWFNGSSAPVSIGISAPESDSEDDYSSESDSEDDDEPTMMASLFNRGTSLTGAVQETTPTKRSPAPQKPKTPSSSTANSRFAWLLSTQKNASAPSPSPSPTYHNPSDDLLNLNIPQSLFPHGAVDPLNPASFNDLLSTAESLLWRYQSSYRALSTALSDARAEASAQEDELDEAETRSRHLKMQLETLAARANEQDAQMARLVEDLNFERRARQEAEVELARQSQRAAAGGSRHRSRHSGSEVSVDSGFDSECDAESEAASIFSRSNCMSPTTDVSSAAASVAGEDQDSTPPGKHYLRQRPTLQRGVQSGSTEGWGCRNCEGGSQAAVWGRLAKEREESRALRRRVEDLEKAVEGALNVVDGPWGLT